MYFRSVIEDAKEVVALEIAMHDAIAMEMSETLDSIEEDLTQFRDGKRFRGILSLDDHVLQGAVVLCHKETDRSAREIVKQVSANVGMRRNGLEHRDLVLKCFHLVVKDVSIELQLFHCAHPPIHKAGVDDE